MSLNTQPWCCGKQWTLAPFIGGGDLFPPTPSAARQAEDKSETTFLRGWNARGKFCWIFRSGIFIRGCSGWGSWSWGVQVRCLTVRNVLKDPPSPPLSIVWDHVDIVVSQTPHTCTQCLFLTALPTNCSTLTLISPLVLRTTEYTLMPGVMICRPWSQKATSLLSVTLSATAGSPLPFRIIATDGTYHSAVAGVCQGECQARNWVSFFL